MRRWMSRKNYELCQLNSEEGKPQTVDLPPADANFLGKPSLFAEDENALLPGEAHFLDLTAFAQQHGVVIGLGVAFFPAAFTLGHHGLAFLHGGSVAVNEQTVFTGLQIGFAKFCGLRDVDRFADGFRKCRHGQRGYRQKRNTSKERIGFHACQPFHRIESAEQTAVGVRRVDTRPRERVDFPERHLLFLD